jgi:hypothetical protein
MHSVWRKRPISGTTRPKSVETLRILIKARPVLTAHAEHTRKTTRTGNTESTFKGYLDHYNAISLEGEQIQDILDDLHRDVIDVDGEVEFKRRVYNGTRSRAVETFRVVGVWNDEEERYHLYITNLPAADYNAADIATLYQARWEVELLFRELKTVYGLNEINSSKPEVVEALILIGLLSLVVSRTLRELFIEIIEENRSDDDTSVSSLLPRERWARAFSRRSDRILRRVAERLGYEPPSLVESLLNDALNPNAHRISLLEEVQHEPFGVDLA